MSIPAEPDCGMHEPVQILKVCAWCGRIIHTGAVLFGQVSHGICGSCLAIYKADHAKLRKETK